MPYKILLKRHDKEFFMKDDNKEIEFKEKSNAERFKWCVSDCERIVGYEVYVVEF